MGFFQTIKAKLGIGGVKVAISPIGQVAKSASVIEGKFTLTTKSDQEVTAITVKVTEEYTTGRGEEKKTKTFTLGETKLQQHFTIKTGEIKEIAYSVPFSVIKSSNDELREKGGALGALGSVASFANNEKSSYYVTVQADVVSAALDPWDRVSVRFV